MANISFNGSDFSAFTDEELVALARSGNDGALNTLAVRMLPLAIACASKFSRLPIYCEDLAQEGMIGLISAVKTYSQNKGASFKTYAGVCIRNAIKTAAIKPKFGGQGEEIYLRADALSGVSANPEDTVISRETLKALQKFIDEKLSDFEKRVFYLYIGGNNYKQISMTLSTQEKAVDNALSRIRRKLKRFA